MMNYDIEQLPKEEWKDYELKFRYTTNRYYDVEIDKIDNGFNVSFVKKEFEKPITKSFTDKLFQPYWEEAQAFGLIKDENLLAVIEIWKENWSNRLKITQLLINEELRRQGIGRKLIDLAKAKAKEWGCRAIILETQSSNEKAIAFYLSQGFSLFGFDRSCYSNTDIENKEVRIELGICLEQIKNGI